MPAQYIYMPPQYICRHIWVLQNVDPVIEILKKINKRKNAKSISTFDFSTLYTKIPHKDLIDKLSKMFSRVVMLNL